eukprot:6490584-Amphidinium_carterae.1
MFGRCRRQRRDVHVTFMMFSKKNQYHCPNCATRWKWGTGRSEQWVLLYKGEDDDTEHFVWGSDHPQNVNQWCEDVTN